MIQSRLISSLLLLSFCLMLEVQNASVSAAETILEESFQTPLSKDWFWGLGTWISKEGVLRGYESGPRRHGPVKLRRFEFVDCVVTYEFRLERGAQAAGMIFNGSQERGPCSCIGDTQRNPHSGACQKRRIHGPVERNDPPSRTGLASGEDCLPGVRDESGLQRENLDCQTSCHPRNETELWFRRKFRRRCR